MNIQEKIYPTPLRVELSSGTVKLSGAYADEKSAQMLESFLYAAEGCGLSEKKDGNVRLVFDESIKNEEGYSIEAKDGEVKVSARTLSGFVFAAGISPGAGTGLR